MAALVRRLAPSSGLVWVLVVAPLAAAQGPLNPSPHTGVCFLDVDADGAAGLEEPIYLQIRPCGGGTSAGDARLGAFAGFPAGTLVNGSHDDAGRPTVPWGAGYGFIDENGDGSFSAGEQLALHAGPFPGTLAPGDLLVSGPRAFERLSGDDDLLGGPVLAAPVGVGAETYAERDGVAGYTTGDFVLLDLDGNGLTTIGDLRLAVPATPRPASPSPSDPGSSASPSPSGAPSISTSDPSTPTHVDPEPTPPKAPGTPQGIPGLAAFPSLVGLLASALLRRVTQGI